MHPHLRRPQPAATAHPIARLAQFAAAGALASCARSEAASVPAVELTVPAANPAPGKSVTTVAMKACANCGGVHPVVATRVEPAAPEPHVVPNGPDDPLRHVANKHPPVSRWNNTLSFGGAMVSVGP